MIFQLKRQIANVKKEGKSLPQYFGDLTDIWNGLIALRPDSTDLKVIQKRREEDKIFSVLMGLDDSYAHLHQEIL